MPVAIFLVLAGITTSNPTMVGGELRIAAGGPARRAPGRLAGPRAPPPSGPPLWPLPRPPPTGQAPDTRGAGRRSRGGPARLEASRGGVERPRRPGSCRLC